MLPRTPQKFTCIGRFASLLAPRASHIRRGLPRRQSRLLAQASGRCERGAILGQSARVLVPEQIAEVTAAAVAPTAFVVLGCRPGRGGLRGAALRRVAACAAVFLDEAGPGDLVLCAGGRVWEGVLEADAFSAALEARGVPGSRVVRERCSMTTGENARYAASLLQRRGVARVRLVTCAWHMPRAAAHFRRHLEARYLGA